MLGKRPWFFVTFMCSPNHLLPEQGMYTLITVYGLSN